MRLKFNEPMPFSRGLEREILYICISGGAVLLVFYLLHPFRFSGLSSLKLLGYGVVSVLAGVIYIVLTHYLYKKLWANGGWTFGWEVLHSLFFLLFIGFSIMVYGSLLHINEL